MSSEKSTEKGHGNLTIYIFGAIVIAFILALAAPLIAMKLEIGGELFLRILKMLVVPLVVTSVMSGILGLGDVRKLGKPGGTAVAYYLVTTVLAVVVGLMVVNITRPGVGFDTGEFHAHSIQKSPKERMLEALSKITGMTEEEVGGVFTDLPSGEAEKPNLMAIVKNLALMLVSENLFTSAAEMDLLPLIVFSILFAAILTTMQKQAGVLIDVIHQANEALMAVILVVMKIAPIGIFCLVAARFGEAQAEGKFIEELAQIGKFFGTVLVGLFIHLLVTLPAILWFMTKRNPYKFLLQMGQALLTAFSTASSTATLPVTMKCATERAGISKRSVEFVTPLGATINMDGTALYEATAAIFIAQVAMIDLSLGQQGIVAVTATLAAIGAAGIPEAGLFTMIIVLNAVNLPVEYIGLILSVDWLLDRFRTAVNVFGDSVGAAIVETTLPPEEEVQA
ncbi:MAG: dicarboxylate/amino acid:cation symporter [Verrucomicrobiales bacterium]|nr:dicarboxylate/amino acid:cation symporter [Verrucomicrobiales bacterium]